MDPVGVPADLIRALDTVAATAHLLVASDFDGTVSPIVPKPTDARPLPGAADALRALAGLPSTTVALVSGRALGSLREVSSMPPAVHLVGSHGAELDSGFTQQIDEDLLERITTALTAIAADLPGVSVEPKPASVALHVRNASAEDGRAALDAAHAAAPEWDAELTEGKSVLEFAVISTDKGEAIDIIRDREGATAVVFFGDDVTDEKAFRRMRDGDVGVKVGPGDTLAAYRVGTPEDVEAALVHLARQR
jgi:trehalose 6-phosphate phosphatase